MSKSRFRSSRQRLLFNIAWAVIAAIVCLGLVYRDSDGEGVIESLIFVPAFFFISLGVIRFLEEIMHIPRAK
jgi:hypothetical protein